MKKRIMCLEFPYEVGSWETWVSVHDFHELCKDHHVTITKEEDIIV